MTLETPIEFLKSIGPERSKLISSVLGISTVEDFLHFFPIRYADKSKTSRIKDLSQHDGAEVLLKGKISSLTELGAGKTKRLAAKFTDGTGTLDLVWFTYSKWLKDTLPTDVPVSVFGKIKLFNGQFSMAHPEIETETATPKPQGLIPIYPASEKLSKRGLNQKFFSSVLKNILTEVPKMMTENLPLYLLESYRLMPRAEAYINIHFPPSSGLLQQAERRLKFEEAFMFQLGFGLKKQHHQNHTQGNPMKEIGDSFRDFYEKHLPFELTGAQKRVLKEIRTDMKRPVQMNRLLQGDVGSGKTMVALLSMLIAIDNGFQACIMAPTEILAQQHFNSIEEMLKGTDVTVQLLTGSTKTAERRSLHENLSSGHLNILVGTHALLEDKVLFQNLGLAVIDEQHRFGVAQRAKLWAKNKIPPHILVMTATPIPRTLAMSVYSDLEISVIDELPVGRKPVITALRREKDRQFVYNFCKEEIAKGRQVYFVYPLIEESESLDYKNLTDGFFHISEFFSELRCIMLHGKMTPAEKDMAMRQFAAGNAQIMVATTVIEVGVNVPNATVMIIESAERFGLSQLHQLRGRVGRGGEQSYCILMTGDKISSDSRARLRTMAETNDGFRIAEVDMQLRGPGDILGTQQSGVIDFKKLDIVQDSGVIKAAKDAVEKMLSEDPQLRHAAHQPLKKFYIQNFKGKNRWSKIS